MPYFADMKLGYKKIKVKRHIWRPVEPNIFGQVEILYFYQYKCLETGLKPITVQKLGAQRYV